MLVYAGIDEAGYGPLLGPLCVAASVFVLDAPDTDDAGRAAVGPPNLWSTLRGAVCRGRRDRRRRIAVDDSKKLKGAGGEPGGRGPHPLHHLERGVLAFLAADDDGRSVADDTALFAALGVEVAARCWYDSSTALPLGASADELRIDAARLRRTFARVGASCPLLRCEAIDVDDFNAGVARRGSKASVNMAAALRLLTSIWDRWPDAHPRVVIDRHGGRTRYREELQLAFPDASIRIVAEEETLSRYRLDAGDRRLTVSFSPAADERHLPVALASMTAKYTRELLMLRLNRFFAEHLPEVKPTAGYVQDGRRYLRDVEPVIRSLRLPRGHLVREC